MHLVEKRLIEIKELAYKGATTDGARHKQWYLEKIFKLLVSEAEGDAYDDMVTNPVINALDMVAKQLHPNRYPFI